MRDAVKDQHEADALGVEDRRVGETGDDGVVRLFRCPRVPEDASVAERLALIAGMAPVHRVIGLPDIHLKPKLESPSSTAIASRGALCPQLSSPSPNCGMALLALDLPAADVLARRDELFQVLREVVPMKRSPYSLTEGDALRAIREGAGFTASWARDLDLAAERVDDGGRLLLPLDGELPAILSPRLRRVAAADYGALGGGNHFLELEEVADVVDAAAAHAYGLAEGQAVVLFHTGSGMFGYEVGRLYSHRRKISPKYLPRILARKAVFHAARGEGWAARRRRWDLFVRPRAYAWVDEDSDEGLELVTALHAAMNFGYANRSAVAAAVASAAVAVFGDCGVRLIHDSCHNSITHHDGVWIHRHNATRAERGPDGLGAPILLPGLDRSSSYVLRPGMGATESLQSVDHGAGGAVTALGTPLEGGPTTVRYRFGGAIEEVEHLSDDGLECVADSLERADLARRVVRTRPLAVLKE